MRQKPPDRVTDHENSPEDHLPGCFFFSMFRQPICPDQGIGLAAAVTGQQAVFLQIAFALGGKVGMADLFGDAGTKILGQMQADGVFYIAPEKRPGFADGRLAFVDDAAFAFPEEDAVAVFAHADLEFGPHIFPKLAYHLFLFHAESGAEPLQVGGADDDTAFPLAAMAAHLTGKGLGFLAHFDILRIIFAK